MEVALRVLAVTTASVAGLHHRNRARNNQDAYATRTLVAADGVEWVVAVVADGCGSHLHSEVGAALGCQWLVDVVAAQLCRDASAVQWQTHAQELVCRLQGLHLNEEVREQFLLFSLFAVAANSHCAHIWALGDGAFVVDDTVTVVGPYPNDAPPYLAYLMRDDVALGDLGPVEQIVRFDRYVAIASDGVRYLCKQSDEGLLELFAPDTLRHPDKLRRKLELCARNGQRADAGPQLLDDTTIAVVSLRKDEP